MKPPATATPRLSEALQGCLLGTAVGDSIGLPFENLSRRSVAKLARLPLEQSLLLGRGLLSDDTEHTVMSALSLLEAGDDPAHFQRRLASRLRAWLIAAPPGVGSATARSILKLWIGLPPHKSGVYSAGNGPAMRAAILGVAFGHEGGQQPAQLLAFVRASAEITHTDPKAFEAALAVAVAASCATRHGPMAPADAWSSFIGAYRRVSPDPAFLAPTLQQLERAIAEGLNLEAFAEQLGCARGVTGYALHTVPFALYAWMRHSQDLRTAVTATVLCGGDTDSTAAIVGAIVGAGLGPQGVPPSWLARLVEWPRDARWMSGLAQRLARAIEEAQPQRPTLASRLRELAGWPWTLTRNLAMFAIVVYVAFRRLAIVAIRSV